MGAVGVITAFAVILMVLVVVAVVWVLIKGSPGGRADARPDDIQRGDAKWRGHGHY